MGKLQEIRKQQGCLFSEAVQKHAAEGNSRALTADLLGVDLSYFRQLCDRFDLHGYFKAQEDMKRICRPTPPGWPKGKPDTRRKRGIKLTDDEILAEIRKYESHSLFQSMASVSLSTVKRRIHMQWGEARKIALSARK